MSATRIAPVRLLTSLSVVLALAASMFALRAVGPTTTKANAIISAAKAGNAVSWARSRKGSPYQYGASGPHRFDCSGLTRWSYARVGKWLPHSSSAQVRHTKRIWHRSNARRGDLVFFYGHGSVYHVGIYAGHGYMWDAPHSGARVHKHLMYHARWRYGRLIRR